MPILLCWLIGIFLSSCIFSKKESKSLPPPTPILIFPEKNKTDTRTSINLKWGLDSLENSSGITYDVYVTSDTSISLPIKENVLDSQFHVLGLNPNTEYFWRVVANRNGGAAASDWLNFTTGNHPFHFLSVFAQWNFSGTGIHFEDNGPFNNKGTLVGPQWVEGGGLKFDGMDDYVTLDTCLMDTSGCWTSQEIVVEMEFTTDSVVYDSIQGLFYSGLFNNSIEIFLLQHFLFSGGWYENGNLYSPNLDFGSEKIGKKSHLILVMDMLGGNNVIYLDGVLLRSQTTRSDNLIAQPGESLILKPSIGAMNINGSFSKFFPGTIHRLNIYKGLPIPIEVEEHYHILNSDF